MKNEDIDFDDVPQRAPTDPDKPEDPTLYLPKELRERARMLPPDQAHTVLELAPEGEGHNASLLGVAGICHRMGVGFDDTLAHLQNIYNADRVDYEIAPLRAVRRVWAVDGDLSQLVDSDETGAPDAKEENLFRFKRTPTPQIVESSPGDVETPTAEIIRSLFEPKEIINIQRSAFEYGTLTAVADLGEYDLGDFHFLNPATFKDIKGVPNPLNGDKISTRCNANVKTRRYMVLEMDTDDPAKSERFNTFAMTMAIFAPLVLAVDTGNKSIHFWFDCDGAKKDVTTTFFGLACLHGADKRLAVKSQIARMPNAGAEKQGRDRQSVIYFDPDRENASDWDIKGFEAYLQQNKQLDYYYHGKNRSFMTRDNLDSWVSLDRTSLRSHLAEKGYRDQKTEGETIAPLDLVINSIQLDKNVEAVVPGASGRHAGVYEENGHRIIVTKSPTFIKPRKGEFPTINAFLTGLFGHAENQKEIFYGWLGSCIRNLRNGGRRQAVWAPAQMLHIIGPPNAGKTLILQDILGPCFANRLASADPLFKKFPDMHNADTFGCELLFLDDSPVLESNFHFRQEFGERIKNHTVGIGGGMRDMQQSRINIRPWWRFVRLMNMEPATLATLPPMDEGIEDKLILLRGEDMELGPLGAEMRLPGWYDRVKARIQDEMPAFIHYLLEEFELPEQLKDPKQRFPVASYKDPQLMLDIEEGSPEMNLVYKFDHDATHMFSTSTNTMFDEDVVEECEPGPWLGTSEQLYDLLAVSGTRCSQTRFVKACPNPRVLISQLRTLEKHHPERVGYSRRRDDYPNKKKGAEYWIIFPRDYAPPVEEDDVEDVELADLL